MKVLFDHQIFSMQVHGGVSKYFAEVIHRLPPNEWEVSAWLSNNEYAKNYKLFKSCPFLPHLSFYGKNYLMRNVGKPYSLYRIMQGKFDVFHQTHFETYCIRALGTKPMVTTYHDVNFLTEMNYNKTVVRWQHKSLERADKVIAISQNTKNDMLRYFDIDPDKIQVIYHGIDSPIYNSEEKVFSVPYILYVGTRAKFKNFERFVHAYALVAEKYPEVKVVCTYKPFTKEELDMFAKLNIQGNMLHCVADEETLSRLYRDALFFVFPSLYEGFGMPILEAMVNGCPVVISDASCFPEIAGDAALYFDPKDIDSIRDSLEKVIEDEALRHQLAKRGIECAGRFSWDRCAKEHWELYKSLL